MKKIGNWILFSITLPFAILSWAFILILWLFRFVEKVHFENHCILVGQWRPWFAKKFKYSTEFGRSVAYNPRIIDKAGKPLRRVVQHELIHLQQVEDLMVLSLIIGVIVGFITGNWILGLIIWTSGGAFQLPNFLTSVLRGHDIYRGSMHEICAYAATQIIDPKTKRLWIDNYYRFHDHF
jgi:hypothetical protein